MQTDPLIGSDHRCDLETHSCGHPGVFIRGQSHASVLLDTA